MPDALFQQNIVNTKGKVRDLIGMRVHSVTSIWWGVFYMSMLFEEFKAQSFIGHNRNYHFLFRQHQSNSHTLIKDPIYNGVAIYNYIPLNDGYFWFRKPITEITSFTMTLGDPDNLLSLPFNIATTFINSFQPTNPGTFLVSTSAIIIKNGSRIYITGFTTPTPTAPVDAIAILNVNNPDGLIASTTDGHTISIPVDLTGTSLIPGPHPPRGPTATIWSTWFDFTVPLELIYLESDKDS
jgi:hypothetical protein